MTFETPRIRLLVADDHPLLRRALREVITEEPDLEVVAEAANGQLAVQLFRAWQPDVVLMDLLMPVQDGLSATQEILAEAPHARVLILTSVTEDKQVVAALQAGAMGYVFKDANPEELVVAIRSLAQGRAFLPPAVATQLVEGLRSGHPKPPAKSPEVAEPPTPAANAPALTTREQEVLKLLGQGLSNQAIAQTLVLSEATVRVHVANLLRKLGLARRSEAIVYALKHKQP